MSPDSSGSTSRGFAFIDSLVQILGHFIALLICFPRFHKSYKQNHVPYKSPFFLEYSWHSILYFFKVQNYIASFTNCSYSFTTFSSSFYYALLPNLIIFVDFGSPFDLSLLPFYYFFFFFFWGHKFKSLQQLFIQI